MEKREAKTRQSSFVDLNDEEYKGPLQHARRKLERLMAAAMPCKKEIHSSTRKLVAELNASHKVPKTKHGSRVESHVSTKQRVESSLPELKLTRRPHSRQKIFFDEFANLILCHKR